ncbi:uncharacterized protein LOC108719545 isoform X1 [Xenopus laevis]|uniref:Uncharacterized protein LOC108719545 isoform X1 n=2 Tax=Xenopus laevis TaxID=8355 RepID=A0A8J0VPP2_XENLA|nr:uncharacterized protein LOC108719545 isoform X1 [Xenopus laevis]
MAVREASRDTHISMAVLEMPFPSATLGAVPRAHNLLPLLKMEENAAPVTGSPEPQILQIKIEKEELDSEDHQNPMENSSVPLINGSSSVGQMKISQTTKRDSSLPRMKSTTAMLTDSYRLIDLVEERPGLYMTESPAYHNKYTRRKLWDEVAANLIDRWENLTDQEKNIKAKEIQLKWKHIKDCYRRELKRQRNEGRGGSSQPKRKKYIYADMLTFLNPCFAKRSSGDVWGRKLTVFEMRGGRIPGRSPVGGDSQSQPCSDTSTDRLQFPISSCGNSEVTQEEENLPGERSDASSVHMSPNCATPPRTEARGTSAPAPKRKKEEAEITPGEVKDMFHTLVNTIAGREAAKTPHPHEHLPEFLFFRGLIPSVLMIPEGQRPLMQAEVVQVINKYIPHLQPRPTPHRYPHSYSSSFTHHI